MGIAWSTGTDSHTGPTVPVPAEYRYMYAISTHPGLRTGQEYGSFPTLSFVYSKLAIIVSILFIIFVGNNSDANILGAVFSL